MAARLILGIRLGLLQAGRGLRFATVPFGFDATQKALVLFKQRLVLIIHLLHQRHVPHLGFRVAMAAGPRETPAGHLGQRQVAGRLGGRYAGDLKVMGNGHLSV